MNFKDILDLVHAGFNADQIGKMAAAAAAGEPKPAEPAPAPAPAEPKPAEPAPAEPKPAEPAKPVVDPVLAAIQQLTETIQASNIRKSEQPNPGADYDPLFEMLHGGN